MAVEINLQFQALEYSTADNHFKNKLTDNFIWLKQTWKKVKEVIQVISQYETGFT